MNRFSIRFAIFTALVVFSQPTFAWTVEGALHLNIIKVKSFTLAKSPANEQLTTFYVVAKITSEGDTTSDSRWCYRQVGGVEFSCGKEHEILNLTIDCEYCGSGYGIALLSLPKFWGDECKQLFPGN